MKKGRRAEVDLTRVVAGQGQLLAKVHRACRWQQWRHRQRSCVWEAFKLWVKRAANVQAKSKANAGGCRARERFKNRKKTGFSLQETTGKEFLREALVACCSEHSYSGAQDGNGGGERDHEMNPKARGGEVQSVWSPAQSNSR
jgi:hypothetical protein